MKTDQRLQQDVVEELRWDPSVMDKEIGVAVRGGVVTLSGTVASYAQKLAAEAAAERVNGVRAVAVDIDIQIPNALQRTDTEIAHMVVNNLKTDVEVPDENVRIRVDDGLVTLTGRVEWQYQRNAADRAVRFLTGVRGVVNRITVANAASTAKVKEQILAALKRTAEVDAGQIQVETANSKVTLHGTVRSWSERNDAKRAAWNAPGVSEVEDDLIVKV